MFSTSQMLQISVRRAKIHLSREKTKNTSKRWTTKSCKHPSKTKPFNEPKIHSASHRADNQSIQFPPCERCT